MNQWLCFGVLLGWVAVALADMGSTNPPSGTCLRVTASALNIRSGAGTSYGIIKTVSYGESFRYAGTRLYSGGYYWYKLDLGGQYGWAAGKYLVLGSQCPLNCMCVTASALNIRSGATTSSSILGTVSNGKCMKSSGQSQYSGGLWWLSVQYNGQNAWAAEKYLQKGSDSQCSSGGSVSSSGSGSGSTYGGCTGRGSVDYNGKTVSDSRVRAKLQQIANFFCRGIEVFSGDRNNGGNSWHDRHRAADFWVNGFNAYTEGIKIWNAFRASTLFTDESWEVIWHGRYTVTSGIHFHIGRRYSGGTCYKMEGTTTSNKGDYRCHPL